MILNSCTSGEEDVSWVTDDPRLSVSSSCSLLNRWEILLQYKRHFLLLTIETERKGKWKWKWYGKKNY